jgi:hypothetical protein
MGSETFQHVEGAITAGARSEWTNALEGRDDLGLESISEPLPMTPGGEQFMTLF